jgi:hypothetical protein
MCSLISNEFTPHFICLSEHYTTTQNLSAISLDNYQLSSNFSHINHIGGGVCIFTRADLQYSICDVSQFCIEKMFGVCVTKLDLGNYYIIVICTYRSPTGNFFNFLNQLDLTLKYLCNTKTEFIICGDLNVDFSKDSNFKLLLSCLLQSYNLFHVVDFPTRFNKTSCSTIDNIFIDNSRVNLFKVLPIINGLSDRGAQYLTLNDVFLLNKGNNSICNKRLITKATISNFITMLKDESWSDIYSHHDVNKSFHSFLNSFLI